MRILQSVEPTAEQLKIMRAAKPGASLIKGAAGSGKTTTALLRLKLLCNQRLARKDRLQLDDPVRVLVLTYNRTLEGYIKELAAEQISGRPDLHIQVTTFGKWAKSLLEDEPYVLDHEDATSLLRPLVAQLPANNDFLIEEVEYLLGRYPPDHLQAYLTTRRDGRGLSPRMEKTARQRLFAEVVEPYQALKAERSAMDWNDVALAAGDRRGIVPWDVVIVDEAQDFSANQIRAIMQHLAESSSVTFVIE